MKCIQLARRAGLPALQVFERLRMGPGAPGTQLALSQAAQESAVSGISFLLQQERLEGHFCPTGPIGLN